jgi:SAM-dependent methyltransferase
MGGRCNFCGSTDRKVIVSDDQGYAPDRSDIVECRECGLVFRVFPEGRDEAGKETRAPFDAPAKADGRRKDLYLDLVGIVLKFRKLHRIFDVGAGNGYFLKLCRDRGWEISGAEADPDRVRSAETEHGVMLLGEPFERTEPGNSCFDGVTFINVLEHLRDPRSALLKAFGMLRPGGCLLVRFPNAVFHVYPYRILSMLRGIGFFRKMRREFAVYRYAFGHKAMSRCLRSLGYVDLEMRRSGRLGSSVLLTAVRP